MATSFSAWVIFNVVVVFLLMLDLFIFHRKPHQIKIKEALVLSIFWIFLSILFGVFIRIWQGEQKALEFFTGYLIEKSLSIDNIFLFIVIFNYFSIKSENQHRLLFWGIIGALIMRAIMIVVGVVLVSKFHWILYLFGVFLVITGIKFLYEKKKDYNPEKNLIIRFFRKFFLVSSDSQSTHFFTKTAQGWAITSYFLALVTIETTDVIFALDSIPAIFAITQDSFIIYTSNVGAILGLRSLYFLLASILPKFIYLQKGIGLLLFFVGCKMLIEPIYKMPTWISLIVIIVVLGVSIGASLFVKKEDPEV